MTPSEKEKIIEEGFDAIRRVYNLRGDLLEDAGKLEAAKESNRKLSDRVANLEVTIRTLNSAIDKKDVEIKRLDTRLKSALTTIETLEKKRDNIYDKYLELCHVNDADEEIKKNMRADNRKKKDEIKKLKEELEAEKKSHCCDGCGSIRRIEALKKGCEENRKVAEKYKSEIAELESNFHELRKELNTLYLLYARGMLEPYHIKAFTDWINYIFGDFGINDEEE